MMAGTSSILSEEGEDLKFVKENLYQIIELQKFHNERLLKSEEEVSQWKKHIKNYEILRARIATLPDKTRHDVMVPLGSLAFMPGQLIHTNEILTLLGDNWFAELSAREASGVINRRIQVCKEKLTQAESVSHIHRGWVDESKKLIQNEANDVKISETSTEEEYIQQKEIHRKNLRKSRGIKEPASTVTDEELLKRLDALIMQETEREEMDDMSDESSMDSDDSEMDAAIECTTETDRRNVLHFKREQLQRRVSWADHITDSEMVEDDIPGDSELLQEQDSVGPLLQLQQRAAEEEVVAPPEPMQEQAASLPLELPPPVQRCNSLSRSERPKGILKKSMSQPVPPHEAEAMKVTFTQNLPEDEDELPASTKTPLSESPKEIRNLKNPAVTYKIVVNE